MRSLFALAALACLFSVSEPARSDTIPITSYDISQGRASGFGGWSNTYSGTISPNGNGTVNYSGGSGTLNDGVLPTSNFNSQLYYLPDSSVTTLHLGGGPAKVGTIALYGFNNNNLTPGNINTVTVTINGISGTFTATGFGPANFYTGLPINQQIDLSGSPLGVLPTNAVSIEVMSLYPFGGDYYQIGEAEVFAASAPEPASLTLLGLGGLGMAGYGWRRRRLAPFG